MNDLRTAAQMALEALDWRFSNVPEAIEALRQALAQPEQEPVAWLVRDSIDGSWYPCAFENPAGAIKGESKPLYTAPPSKPWVGLDDDDFEYQPPQYVLNMKYAEAILREKNK